MGLSGERRQRPGGGAPQAQYELDKGWGRSPPFPSPSPLLSPFPTPEKERGILLGLGSPSRTPPWCAPSRLAAPSSPPLYTWEGGTLKTHQLFSLPCVVTPSTIYSSGHSIVVLRRSPGRITSPSPSPYHRADGTLPQPSARSRVQGMSSS